MRERIAQFQVAAVLAAFVTLTASSRAASQELARAQKPASLDSAAIDETSARMFIGTGLPTPSCPAGRAGDP